MKLQYLSKQVARIKKDKTRKLMYVMLMHTSIDLSLICNAMYNILTVKFCAYTSDIVIHSQNVSK